MNPPNSTLVLLPERVLPLQGARNFRDLGGYRTASGQRVKWRRLFRSEHLTHLSDADCLYLRDIGIRTAFDLRTRVERERNPSRWHAESEVETFTWKDTENMKGLAERLQHYRKEHGLQDAAHLRGFLSLHYRSYLEVQADRFRDILAKLTQPNAAPALLHCTAGKDRTGIIVALILHLLGVNKDTIFEDYLLTNACADSLKDQARFRMLLQQFGIDEISEEGVEALRCAHPEYLQAAFDGMRENYGSVENYLEQRLGMDAEKIDTMRSLYLEG